MALSLHTQKRIIALYQQKGLSMLQVAGRLCISEKAVLYYLQKYNIARRSSSEAARYAHITRFGKQPFKILDQFTEEDKSLKIAGVMLYWAEGTKGWGSVNFTNSDPAMIKLFLKFLRRICGAAESRIHALLHLYPDQNILELENFWSDITQIPKQKFYRTHIHKGKKGTYKHKSIYGTIAISYSDTRLLSLIESWIQEYSNL